MELEEILNKLENVKKTLTLMPHRLSALRRLRQHLECPQLRIAKVALKACKVLATIR